MWRVIPSLILTQVAAAPAEQCTSMFCKSEEEPPAVSVSAVLAGFLRPRDLPGPVVFKDFTNGTAEVPGGVRLKTASGSVAQPGEGAAPSFAVLEGVVPRAAVQDMLGLLEGYEEPLDADPDSVDGMPTYEIFLESTDLGKGGKALDQDSDALKTRTPLREKLRAITQPLLDEKITPFVRERYPEACRKGAGRACTPCYSLIRRYRHDERQSHATHHDGHALVTVVVSLSDYDAEYRGGLFVAASHSSRQYLALNRGDAVVHQSTLLHGVQVAQAERPERTRRWSWILW